MTSINTLDTILLAEDSQDDVYVFKRALQTADIKNPVVTLDNGQDVVEYLSAAEKIADRDDYPLPFLMFLDLKLPCLDGFEILNWIKSRPDLQSMVVVVLSHSDQPADHLRAYALGARSYLVKPPQPEQIRQFISSMGSRW